jgi:predicted HAD superfamily Cof-like phosphohydrolase
MIICTCGNKFEVKEFYRCEQCGKLYGGSEDNESIICLGHCDTKDKLDDIFERNKKFTDYSRANSPREGTPEKMMEKFYKSGQINEDEYKRGILEMHMIRNSLAIYAEVAEYVDEIPYKWWGRGAWELDRAKAVEELIDLLHFVMVAFDDVGCDAFEIHSEYVKKNNRNWKRFEEKDGWKVPQR